MARSLDCCSLSVKIFSITVTMLLSGWEHPCAAQSPVDDFLPLSVGNQWIYKYLTSSADYLGDMFYNDSGVVRYSIVSKAETADSILWRFTEIRDIVHFSTHIFPPQYSLADTIRDTTRFSLVEFISGNHRLVRAGAGDWKSVFSMTAEFADSLSYFRYHPQVNTDTFTTTADSPANNPYQLVTTFYRRYQGIVKTSYNLVKIVGSAAHTNHSLLSVSISLPADDSLRREYFPLHKGDTWQYAMAVPLQLSYKLVPQIVTVVDSLLPNGYRYAGLSYVSTPNKIFKFLRVDSLLRVQEFHPELGDTCGGGMNELNTYRLGEKDGTVWTVCSKMGMTYLPPKSLLRFDGFSADGTYMNFTPGDPRDSSNPRWSLTHQLRRGVGLWLQPNDADGPDTFLWGAVINGKIYGNTITAVAEKPSFQPLGFSLGQNYPNPFNPSTTITFSLPARSFVHLKIFDVLGKEVATIVSEELTGGNYSRQWNATGVPSGVYFYRLQAGSYTETKRLLLLR